MKEELENSVNYLTSKVGKSTGFETPKHHLDILEDQIFVQLFEEKLPKRSGFSTPTSYLDDIEEVIFAKVSSTNKKVKVTSLKQRILKVVPYVAAASVLLFITLNNFNFNSKEEFSLDSLNDTDIEYWINTSDVSYNDIAIVFDDFIAYENEFSLTNIKNESIEEYIYSIDNTSLLNEIN